MEFGKLKKIIFKYLLLIFIMCSTNGSAQKFSKSALDELFKQHADSIVDELRFNYQYDQAMREYILYKTFDKSVTDSLENLEHTELKKYVFAHNFKTNMEKRIWDEHIDPASDKFTESLIRVSKEYGFPSLGRIKKFYKGMLPDDSEFNPVIIFIHANPQYYQQIKELVTEQFNMGIIGKCDYGYIMWHITGRKESKYLDDNGIKNGKGRQDGIVYLVYPCVDEYN